MATLLQGAVRRLLEARSLRTLNLNEWQAVHDALRNETGQDVEWRTDEERRPHPNTSPERLKYEYETLEAALANAPKGMRIFRADDGFWAVSATVAEGLAAQGYEEVGHT